MQTGGRGLIKIFLIIFIAVAVYLGNKDLFNTIPSKIKDNIPYINEEKIDQDLQGNHYKEHSSKSSSSKKKHYMQEDGDEMLNFEFSSQKQDSLIGKAVSDALNKILETKKGRMVLKEVLQKMMRQSHEIAGHDLFLSRYLAHDILNGTGNKAVCGSKVDILYKITDLNYPEPRIGQKKAKTQAGKKGKIRKTIVIGKGALRINLENGIIGMQEGGRRTIIYPKKFNNRGKLQQSKNNSTTAVVELISIKNTKISSSKLGKAFFDKIPEKYSSGIRLICGDIVTGSYSLSDLGGKILYDSAKSSNSSKKNFSFKIGSPKIPPEVSNALLGLPAYDAAVSFVTFPPDIKESFSKMPQFIPKKLFTKNFKDPVILKFKLKISRKI